MVVEVELDHIIMMFIIIIIIIIFKIDNCFNHVSCNEAISITVSVFPKRQKDKSSPCTSSCVSEFHRMFDFSWILDEYYVSVLIVR